MSRFCEQCDLTICSHVVADMTALAKERDRLVEKLGRLQERYEHALNDNERRRSIAAESQVKALTEKLATKLRCSCDYPGEGPCKNHEDWLREQDLRIKSESVVERMRKALELADAVIKTSDDYDNFDCPHMPEDSCNCGLVQVSQAKEWNLAKNAYERNKEECEALSPLEGQE